MERQHLAAGSQAFGWWLLDLKLDGKCAATTLDGAELQALKAVKKYAEAESLERLGPHKYAESIQHYNQCIAAIVCEADGPSEEEQEGPDLEHDEWESGIPQGLPLGLVLANAYSNAAGLAQAQGDRSLALELYLTSRGARPLNEYASPLINAASLARQAGR